MNDHDSTTLLHRFLHWERTQPDAVAFTQPHADGTAEDYTWKQVGDQARRMAAHLRVAAASRAEQHRHPGQEQRALDHGRPGHLDGRACLGAAVSDAQRGHGAVHLRALRHPVIFLGKLDGKTDGWNEVRKVLPAGMHRIALPMSPPSETPRWEEVAKTIEPLQDVHLPAAGRPGDHHLHLGHHRESEGRDAQLRQHDGLRRGAREFLRSSPAAIACCRTCRWHTRPSVPSSSRTGFTTAVHVFFSDCLETFDQDLRRARPTLFISMPRLWTKFYGASAPALRPTNAATAAGSDGAGARENEDPHDAGLAGCPAGLHRRGAAAGRDRVVVSQLGLELLDVYGQSEDFAWSHYSRPGEVRSVTAARRCPAWNAASRTTARS
jgi:hypothetical protein